MCIHPRKIYKQHVVCFRCRVSLKDITVCPYCRQPMMKVSLSFKAPPRNKIREWADLRQFYEEWAKKSPEWFQVRLTHKKIWNGYQQ